MPRRNPNEPPVELLAYNLHSQGDLGSAYFPEFRDHLAPNTIQAGSVWNLLAKLSAYSGQLRLDAGIGRGTPQLGSFMFAKREGLGIEVPVMGVMCEEVREKSYVALSGLYGMMSRRDEIHVYGLSDAKLDITAQFLNSKVEELAG